MKIESATTENTLKSKLEKIYKSEDSSMFREIMNEGLVSFDINNISLKDNLLWNDFISNTEEDIKSLKSSFKYDCLTMDRHDAMFFAKSIKGENYSFSVNGEVLMQNMATDVQSIEKTYKSAEVSKTLIDMLSNSQSTQKPVRIDFGNDISAILRVSQDGKISAEFIPSDKVAEEYLKNNISYLQQTFKEQDIPYNDLSYRQQRQKGRQNNNDNQNNRDKRGE